MDVGKHPIINKLVEQFRLEQKNTEIIMAQLKSGDSYEKRKRNQEANLILKETVGLYETLSLKDYLERIVALIYFN